MSTKNELITKPQAIAIKEINGQPVMSSLRIAEITGKEHKNVLRDIKTMFKALEIDATQFLASYIYGNNNKAIYFLLPEREFQILISGYSISHRATLIDELMSYRKSEVTTQLPQTYISALEALLSSERVKEQLTIENKTKDLKIKEDAPKVLFADNISKAINSINIGSYAKALSEENGIKIGQNKLFAFLRDNGILIKTGRRKNDPMQKYLDNNYLITVESDVITPTGIIVTRTTLITGKGQLGLADKILTHFNK